MAYIKAAERSEQLVAAAREVLTRDGVAGTTLRAVAAQAQVPLGTLHYVFPSKEQLLKAVLEDVVNEIAGVLEASSELDKGLEHALRRGLESFWAQLVEGDQRLQLMQYELTTYSLRTKGLESLARWQYERYCRIVADWSQQAANNAGETCAVPFDTLSRALVAGMDGIILQHVCDPDAARSRRVLDAVTEMIIHLAGARPARSARAREDISA